MAKKIVVLGGGLAGLSAAWYLQQKGGECLVFEKEKEVGGLCRSKKINGFTFDCDGHLLHFRNNYTLELVRRLLKGNLARHERSAWVYVFGNSMPYPFQANLYCLPRPVARECLVEFLKGHESRAINKTDNFLKWVNNYFGSGIARHFMIPYNEKFWTIPSKELTCAWLHDFIPKPTLAQVVRGYYTQDSHQFGYNANFYYPEAGGINQLPLALESRIRNVYKNCRISSIDLKKKELVIAGKTKEKFDTLIFTLPLPELASLVKTIPKDVLKAIKMLRWNSIFNINLGIEASPRDKKHWIYFPQRGISFFRVGFFHNFSAKLTPSGKSSLYTEVSYSKNKPLDKKGIVSRVLNDLKENGILKSPKQIIARDINDIKYGYPIYDKNYRRARGAVIKFLLGNDVIPCGRYGSWRYMSMEDVILDGKKIADKIDVIK